VNTNFACCCVCIDVFFLMIFGGVALPVAKVSKECSPSLGAVGLFFIFYWLFNIFRNMVIICSVQILRDFDPTKLHAAAKLTFMVFDLIAMIWGATYGTLVLRDEETSICVNEVDGILRFKNVLAAHVVMAYLYVSWLVIALCCSCAIGIAYLRMPRNEFNRRANNVPMARAAMDKVTKKQFKDYSKEHKEEADKCIICFEEFKDEDNIAELNCDDRHIFHTACIQQWLEHNMVCPTCRKPVSQ